MNTKLKQIHTIASCAGGWTMDALDFFIMIFVLKDIAMSFNVTMTVITWAITIPLATRVLGALLLGRLADRFGRKPLLLINMIAFVLLELGTSFAPNLAVFLILRAGFGLVMGGEWGVCTSLAMESIPPTWRGFTSGILQSGYSVGYLLAAILYGVEFQHIGWRGMFFTGVILGLIVVVMRCFLTESPVWKLQSLDPSAPKKATLMEGMQGHWKLFGYCVLFMGAAATFSHGTQDLFPTMLRVQRHMDVHTIAMIAIIYNIGAVLGCWCGGTLSQYIGRRWQIILATSVAIIILPFWATAETFMVTAITAAIMQFLVQCTYGVLPAYLNELAPPRIRSTFGGFIYQVGNFLTAANATLQSYLAATYGQNFSLALGVSVGFGIILFGTLAFFNRESATNNTIAIDSTPA